MNKTEYDKLQEGLTKIYNKCILYKNSDTQRCMEDLMLRYKSLLHSMQVTEDSYRWHDLRINPNDLPDIAVKVLVLREELDESAYEYAIDSNCHDDRGYDAWGSDLLGYAVVKWRYIDE